MSARRLYLPVLVAALALFVVPGALASGWSNPRIVCPLTPGAVIPCCPLPVTGPIEVAQPICCPTSALCVASLTIASAPNPSIAARRVTVSGQVIGAASGTQVTLWQKLPGGSSFKPVAAAGTDASGRYVLALVKGVVESNRQFYVSTASERSATIDQRVVAMVSMTRAMQIQVSPNHAAQRILIEQLTARGWTVIARPRLNAASSYTLRRHFSGSVRLRAVLPGDRRNVTSYSKVIRA